jgi:hypothetical protein
LGDLAAHPDVLEGFGGTAAVAALPSRRPDEAHVIASIRSAKTMLAAAAALSMGLSVDVSGLAGGDIVRLHVAALKLDGTRPLMHHVLDILRKPALKGLTRGDPGEGGIDLIHPSGRTVEIVPVPIDRAGGSALSTWSAGVVVDEEPRMIGAEDGVKNWDEFYRGVIGRIRKGGMFLGIGSPHAPFGPIYELHKARFGKPGDDVVIMKGRGPAMNPVYWTPERCEKLRRRDPETYRSDVLADFRSTDASAFPLDAVDEAIGRERPADGEYTDAVICIDLSAMKHDSIGIGVYRWIWPSRYEQSYVWDSEAYDWVVNPDRARPMLECLHIEGLDPNDPAFRNVTAEYVASRVALLARTYGVRVVAGDQMDEFSFPAVLRAHAPGVVYHICRWTAQSKPPAIEKLRTLLVSRAAIFPNHPKLREEFVNYRRVVTQAGERFEPGAGSTHGDHVATAITALMLDIEGNFPQSPSTTLRTRRVWDPYGGERQAA